MLISTWHSRVHRHPGCWTSSVGVPFEPIHDAGPVVVEPVGRDHRVLHQPMRYGAAKVRWVLHQSLHLGSLARG